MLGRPPLPSPFIRNRLVIGLVALALLIGAMAVIRSPARSPVAGRAPGGGGAVAPIASPPRSAGASGAGASPGTARPSPVGSPPAVAARVVVLHVPILTWHVIAPASIAAAYSEPALAVDPARFRAQLQLLHDRGWHTITMAALAELLASGTPAPAKTFVITIDDGYADGFTYALPILQADGFVATYYVIPGRVGGPHEMTWDQISALAAAGMEIGNHTMLHKPLNLLPANVAHDEVVGAQLAIQAHLGSRAITLAYPFGGFDPAVAREVEAAGLWIAATTRWGTSETWAARMAIPRVHISPSESGAVVLGICQAFG